MHVRAESFQHTRETEVVALSQEFAWPLELLMKTHASPPHMSLPLLPVTVLTIFQLLFPSLPMPHETLSLPKYLSPTPTEITHDWDSSPA